jgi:membrane associated rhomboid family serine protease
MFPVKDNIPNERFPLATVTAIAIGLVAFLMTSNHEGLPAFLLDILFLGLLAPSVEGTLGHIRFFGVCILGILLAHVALAVTGVDSPSNALLGISGVTTVVLGGYLLLHPRARVLTLVLAPFFTTIVEIPAVGLIGLWLLLQLCFVVAGVG